MTSTRYQVGGALRQDVSSYVTRDSDRQLLEALKAGEFCYVLNSRQMGKSSLMVRTLAQLQESGWKGITLDFSAKDTQSDRPDSWYFGIINELNKKFQLFESKDCIKWFKERDIISPVERLGEFIETVLLPGIIEPIVIFVDEIDSTLGLPFTDDFFALIRACYNRRAEKPDYKRLTFALLGVAAPSELIGDTKRTPFNIGKSIDLSGFTLAEAQPLAAGLDEKSENPQAVLEAILYWTGGQPFLSQRLCQLVADANDHITAGNEASFVEELVRSRLIENWESQDQQSHLKTIRDRVIKNEQKAGYLLELYRQTRQAGSLPVQNRPEEQELQLSGLVVKREGNLQVYNPIYAEVFNESWIDGELAKLRPYAESFRAWVISGKTDKSRLLRGDALKEAEQWAKEKNPSAEDQDFLSASRIQKREEEIAVKEREAELERERQDKEAAENARKIEAEAKEIAEKGLAKAGTKIRTGTLVLAVTLALSGVSVIAAITAFEQVQVAQMEATQAQMRVNEAKKQATQAQKAQQASQIEQKKAEIQVKNIQKAAKDAKDAEELAQRDLTKTQADKEKLSKEAIRQKNDAKQAKEKAESAKSAEKQANLLKEKAVQAASKTNEGIKSIKSLLELAEELRQKGESSASSSSNAEKLRRARVVSLSALSVNTLKRAGRSVLIKDEELKQAWLLAAIAEACNKDGQIKKAKDSINKSLSYLNKSNDQSVQSNQVKAFAYFISAQINDNKQDHYKVAYQALKDSGFDPSHLKQEKQEDILSPRDYELILYQFIKSDKLDINSPVVQSFRKYFLDGLELFLKGTKEKADWEAADEKTYDLMRNIAQISDQDGFKEKDFDNFSCADLVIIDKLWRQYSNDRFGFSVQKQIWQNSDIGENLGKFVDRVGWGQLNKDNTFTYWYMQDTPFDPDKAPHGKLPWAVTYYNGDHEKRKHYLKRLVECFPNSQ